MKRSVLAVHTVQNWQHHVVFAVERIVLAEQALKKALPALRTQEPELLLARRRNHLRELRKIWLLVKLHILERIAHVPLAVARNVDALHAIFALGYRLAAE